MDARVINDRQLEPATIETWPASRALRAQLDSQARAIEAVDAALPMIARAVAMAVPRLRNGGRLVYAGAGSSGRIAAQDRAELFPTFGWPVERSAALVAGGPAALAASVEGAEDDAEAGADAVAALALRPDDVLVAVAASGTTPWTEAALREAAAAGALTVALASRAGTPLLAGADVPILLATGAEVLPGSTRLAAGTAQKIALNLFSTQLMMGLGRVHRGRMVHMVASNAKLAARGERMVEELTGCCAEAARQAFREAGHAVPLAVLMVDGWPIDQARALLDRCNGDLGAARRARPPDRP